MLRLWGIDFRPEREALVVVVVVLVVVLVVVELLLLCIGVMRIAVELSCSRRPPSNIGGGSACAEPPRKKC